MLRINLFFQKKYRQNKRKSSAPVDFFIAKSELDHKKSKKQDEKKKYLEESLNNNTERLNNIIN